MKTVLLIVGIAAAAIALTACTKEKEEYIATDGPDSADTHFTIDGPTDLYVPDEVFMTGNAEDLVYFSLSESHSYIDECGYYRITNTENGIVIMTELYNQKEVYAEFAEEDMKALAEHLEKFPLDKWNGFSGSNSQVLDGSSYAVSAGWGDGRTFSISGYQKTPRGMTAEFWEEIDAICRPYIDKALEEYREELYPKTLSDDAMIDYFFFETTQSVHTKLHFEIRPWSGTGHDYRYWYNFDGSQFATCVDLDAAPFEELTDLVRKYGIVNYNGYENDANRNPGWKPAPWVPYDDAAREDAEVVDTAAADWERDENTHFLIGIFCDTDEEISLSGYGYPDCRFDGFEAELVELFKKFNEEHGDEFEAFK